MSVWTERFGKKQAAEEENINYGFEEEKPTGVTSAPKAGGSALELKIVRPETYDAVGGIADHLINRRTVVLNLEATNKETAKRIIDFLSGVAYSIGGSIRRVATNTFVITPNNVDVTGETIGDTRGAAPKTSGGEGGSSDFDF